jgi:hypothetical protein
MSARVHQLGRSVLRADQMRPMNIAPPADIAWAMSVYLIERLG